MLSIAGIAVQYRDEILALWQEEARKAAPQDGFERAWALWKRDATGK